MSDLTLFEKKKLDMWLEMGDGYLLNFTNRSFGELVFHSVGIDIYDDKYAERSGSKANRFRSFWDKENNYTVGKVLKDIFENWSLYRALNSPENPPVDAIQIVKRLMDNAPVPEIDSIKPLTPEKEFEQLVQSIKKSIEENRPEEGLDRLHTYLIKFFRQKCSSHGFEADKSTPLHSLVGKYSKLLTDKGFLESEISEKILKSSISVLDTFNKVRNDHSYAHDNKVLNYDESILIFGYVTNLIKFIQQVDFASSNK